MRAHKDKHNIPSIRSLHALGAGAERVRGNGNAARFKLALLNGEDGGNGCIARWDSRDDDRIISRPLSIRLGSDVESELESRSCI